MNSLYFLSLLDLTSFLCSIFFVFGLWATLFFEIELTEQLRLEEFKICRRSFETYSTSLFKTFSSRVVTFLFCTRHKLSCWARLSFRNTCLKVDVLYILSNVFCQKLPNFTPKVPKILPQIFILVF